MAELDEEILKANRRRSADLIYRLRPGEKVWWCPRCGNSFTDGGARTIFRGDMNCHVRSKFGPIAAAIADLTGKREQA